MSTVQTAGRREPPQITTNVVGVKKIRKTLSLVAGVGSITVGDIRTCLPLDLPELRIMKLSVWGPDANTLGAIGNVSVVFPVGTASNTSPGDNAVWVDEGTTGQQRAQIHLQPCFEYRNFWFNSGVAASTLIATFGSTQSNASLIVDITVQYRTAIQSCPALEHLRALQAEDQLCQELLYVVD